MSPHFHIGEIAIIQNVILRAEFNGRECEVIGPLAEYVCRDPIGAIDVLVGYPVLIEGRGKMCIVRPCNLRKKRPPEARTGELRVMELFTKLPVNQPETEPA